MYPTMERCSGYLKVLIQGAAVVIFVLQMILAVQKYQSTVPRILLGVPVQWWKQKEAAKVTAAVLTEAA